MMRHFFSVKRQVEVDECPGCGGFRLDAGKMVTPLLGSPCHPFVGWGAIPKGW